MTFLLNRAGTRQWSEINDEELRHVIEPAMRLPLDHQRIPWIDDAEHGQIVLLDGMRIVCVDLSDDEVSGEDDDVGDDVPEAGMRGI